MSVMLVVMSLHVAYAQNAYRDSLEQVLETELSDSLRVKTQIALSSYYQFIDFSKCYQYADEAYKLAEKSGSAWAKVASYGNLASYYTLSGDYSTALKYDNLALQNSILTHDSALIAKAYNYLGNDYYDLGEYDEAYFYFTQSYGVAKRINDSLKMAIGMHNVGRVFKELGQYERALDHLSLSLKISERIGDTPAKPYYYSEAGDILLRKGEYDSAMSMLLKAFEFARRQNIGPLKPKILTKIADVYLKKADFTRAISCYDSTYALYRKTNNQYGIAEINLGKGLVLLREKKYDAALALIERSLATARTINAKVLEIQCNKNLYAIWEERGEYQKALEYFKQYKITEDSLFSQEMLQKLYRDQYRFETESKDMQIAVLSQVEARQKDLLQREEFFRNILAVIFALSVILLVTVYRSGRRRKQINTLLLQHHEEMERRSEELERLNQVKDKFFSIISHDLRSPINALAGILDIMAKGALSSEEFERQTRELRIRFNHTRTLLNNLLDWTLLQMDKLSLQPGKIDLHKIVEENVELLTSLQTKKINLINLVPENAIAFADSNTINLVIRNLMTNAIKFTNDGGEVTISGQEKEREWVLSVHDNGVGIKSEVQQILFDKTSPYTTRGTANEKGTGLGLILCKEFVEKNGGNIGVKSEAGKGSTFWFTVPKP